MTEWWQAIDASCFAGDDRVGAGIRGVVLVAPLGVGLEFVVEVAGGVVLLLGVLEVFEEVGVEDGGGDFVVPGGPLAEVDGAAALGAEGDFGGVEGNEFFADGAVEGFGHDDCSVIRLLLAGLGFMCGPLVQSFEGEREKKQVPRFGSA
jgi:hypothetical protein